MPHLLGIDVGKTNLRVGVFGEDLQCVERWSERCTDIPSVERLLQGKLMELQTMFSVEAVGISIFGPLQTDRSKADHGAILESSDPAWSHVNIPALVRNACCCPVWFDYDVNAGALAEARAGVGAGARSFYYLSVGTGIGGVIFRDQLAAGFAPQFGHTYVPREDDDREFEGSCRFHGPCLQGLASGRALELRWGKPAEALDPEHPAWDLEARYLARACANLVYTFSPERIVLASSVGCNPELCARVNQGLRPLLNGFLEPELRALYAATEPVIPARLRQHSSLVGAALLAREQAGVQME